MKTSSILVLLFALSAVYPAKAQLFSSSESVRAETKTTANAVPETTAVKANIQLFDPANFLYFDGAYELPNGEQLFVSQEGELLSATLKGMNYTLFPANTHHFISTDGSMSLEFVRDMKGEVTAVNIQEASTSKQAVKIQ